jgi:hypothetical protein
MRYEAELAQSAVSAVESDLASRAQQDPSKIRQVIENESKIAELLTTLPTMYRGAPTKGRQGICSSSTSASRPTSRRMHNQSD